LWEEVIQLAGHGIPCPVVGEDASRCVFSEAFRCYVSIFDWTHRGARRDTDTLSDSNHDLSDAGPLEQLAWRDDALGEMKAGPIRHVFVMAGVAPKTEGLKVLRLGPNLAAFTGGNQRPLHGLRHARS
jgi:hypothetical protein